MTPEQWSIWTWSALPLWGAATLCSFAPVKSAYQLLLAILKTSWCLGEISPLQQDLDWVVTMR